MYQIFPYHCECPTFWDHCHHIMAINKFNFGTIIINPLKTVKAPARFLDFSFLVYISMSRFQCSIMNKLLRVLISSNYASTILYLLSRYFIFDSKKFLSFYFKKTKILVKMTVF